MDINNIVADYDELILQTENVKNTLYSHMEECYMHCKSISKTFLTDFLNSNSIKIITDNINLSQSIGVEGLTPLKSSVTQLINDVETIVEDKLSSPALWWHLAENDLVYKVNETLPEQFDKEFRYIIGMLGEIMSTQGYIVTKPTTFPSPYDEKIIWAELNGDTWIATYLGELEYPKELLGTINNYGLLLEDVKNKNNEIERLEIEKEKAKIANMWNSL